MIMIFFEVMTSYLWVKSGVSYGPYYQAIPRNMGKFGSPKIHTKIDESDLDFFVTPKNQPENADFREKGSKTFSSKVLTDILLQDLSELIPGNFNSIFRIVGHFLKIF